MDSFISSLGDFSNHLEIVSFLPQYCFYCLMVMFFLFYDQKHISRGIKNLAAISFSWDRNLIPSITSLLVSYFFITFYAIVTVECLVYPFISTFKFLDTVDTQTFSAIFILSSGIIVRYIYVLTSSAFANVLWDFYAIPGIFLGLFFYGSIINEDFINFFLAIVSLSCLFGIIAEGGLVLFRKRVRNTFERNYLHEILDLFPLSSKIICGRNELYNNLSDLLWEGITQEQNKKTACGTSIFFEDDDKGKYQSSMKAFIKGGGEIRYLGPLEKQHWEDSESWETRKEQIAKRKEVGVIIKNHPLNSESFRFLIVNQRYVSIQFPISHLSSQDSQRSIITTTFDNVVIANIFQSLFDSMWNNAE